MKKAKTISVVVLAFNEEAYIGDCLNAIYKQTRKPDEVIVVDNNSTDRTLEVATKFKGVKVVKESQQGIVFARNRGMGSAKGDLLVRMDADTVLDPSWIEQTERKLLESKAEGISTYIKFYDGKETKLGSRWINWHFFKLNKLFTGVDVLMGSNMMLTRSAWNRISPNLTMRTDVMEDFDMAVQMNLQNLKVDSIDQTLAGISERRLANSIGSNKDYILGWPKAFWKVNKLGAIGIAVVAYGLEGLLIFGWRMYTISGFKPKTLD